MEIISHSDGRVDMKSLSAFINSYQSVVTLKLGELWAIPIMLRLALLENLRRLSAQIAVDILNKNLAGYWADEMTETAEKDPKNLSAGYCRYGKVKSADGKFFCSRTYKKASGTRFFFGIAA
ncbi:MAG: hypothetical protein WKF59_14910 [Chitinophagaceae bacterium]